MVYAAAASFHNGLHDSSRPWYAQILDFRWDSTSNQWLTVLRRSAERRFMGTRNHALDGATTSSVIDGIAAEMLSTYPNLTSARSADSVYSTDVPLSLSLKLWTLITDYRAAHEGNTLHKFAASGGYLLTSVVALVESIVFGSLFIVGQPLLQGIDGIVGHPRDAGTLALVGACVDRSVQALVQNIISSATNIDSHGTNLHTAQQVRRGMEGRVNDVMQIINRLMPWNIAR